MIFRTPLLLAIAAATPLVAQDRGQAATFAFGMSTTSDGDLLYSSATRGGVLSDSFPTSGPAYDLSAMFPGFTGAVAFEAFSTGNDLVPLTDGGIIDAAEQDAWVAMFFSVDGNTVGNPSGPPASRPASDRQSSVFGYYFSSSQGLADSLLGNSFLEQRAGEIGFSAAANIDALDLGMPILAQNNGQGDQVSIINANVFYFTVQQTSAFTTWLRQEHGNVGAWSSPSGTSYLAAGESATIYRMVWVPGTTSWTLPEVYKTASELGLSSSTVIDALAVDDGANRVVFSTAGAPRSHQLMAVDYTGWGPMALPVQLREIGGDLITERIIGEGEEVDAICIEDPELDKVSSWLGQAVGDIKIDGSQMSLSIARERTGYGPGPSTWVMKIGVCGWGGVVPSNCSLALWTQSDPINGPLLTVPRSASEECVWLELPLTPPTEPASGVEFLFAAFLIDGNNEVLTGSRMIKLRSAGQ